MFDLFGTLTEPMQSSMWDDVAGATAALLQLRADVVRAVSDRSVEQRMRGAFGNSVEAATELARLAGREIDQGTAQRIATLRQQMLRPHLRLETAAVLPELRSYSVQCGVLSNCLPETVDIWRDLPLPSLIDVAGLSPVTGLLKPDAAAYLDVLARIGIAADQAVYVSDGDRAELQAAAALGMTAVHFSNDENVLEGFNNISALRDVLALVG